jgi:hypothetical protein
MVFFIACYLIVVALLLTFFRMAKRNDVDWTDLGAMPMVGDQRMPNQAGALARRRRKTGKDRRPAPHQRERGGRHARFHMPTLGLKSR